MHTNKTKAAKTAPTAPETLDASEAVRELTAHVIAGANATFANLEGMALRDAKLNPADGWRYDANARRFVKVAAS